jgi:O-antigen ligase
MLTARSTSRISIAEQPSAVAAARPVPHTERRGVLARMATLTVAVAVALLPLLRPDGPGNSAPVDLAIIVAVGTTLLAVIAARAPVRLPYVIPVGMLIVAGGTAALLHEATTTAVVALGQDLLVFLFAAAIVNACRTPAEIGAVLRTWSLSAMLWAGVMVFAVAVGDDGLAGVTARTGSRAALTFGDANLAASYFVISLLVIAAARTPRRRFLRWGAYGLLGVAILLTGSLGGMLSLALALGVLAVRALARRFGAMAALAIVLLAGPVVLVGIRGAYDALTHGAQDPNSALHDSFGRVGTSSEGHDQILSEDVHLLANASLFGEGPTSTKDVLAREQLSYIKEAHNDYLGTAIERGGLGVLALVLLVGSLAMRGRRALARADQPAMVASVPAVPALVAALVAVACTGMFYEVLHFRHVWALFGIVAAIALVREP